MLLNSVAAKVYHSMPGPHMNVRNWAHQQLYPTVPNRQVFGVLQKMRNSVASAEKGQYIFEIGAVGTFCSAEAKWLPDVNTG